MWVGHDHDVITEPKFVGIGCVGLVGEETFSERTYALFFGYVVCGVDRALSLKD